MYAGLILINGVWLDVNTRLENQWNQWNVSFQDDSYTDCALIDLKTGYLIKDNCKVELYPVCRFSRFPVDFQLRGVCLHSQVDSFFLLKNPTELAGHGKSTIKWFQSEQVWKIINSTTSLAVLTGPQPKFFPLGDHLWEFTLSSCTDPGEEGRDGGRRRTLNLHAALDQPGHFCCGDGSCLSSNSVCDGRQDCQDRRDEQDCTMVILPTQYQYEKAFPPPVEIITEYDRHFENLVIPTEITIIDLLEITESGFDVVFKTELSWKDSRLKYRFLKDNSFYNELNQETKDQIWLPDLQFSFLHDSLQSIRTLQKRIFVKKETTPRLSKDIDFTKYFEVYEGSENHLVYISVYKATFSCSFSNIGQYPFGEEICTLDFFLQGIDNNLVSINLSQFSDQGPTEVGKFLIKEWKEREGNATVVNNFRNVEKYFGK